MLDYAVRDIYPLDTLVVRPLIQQDPMYGAGVAPFQEDYRVVHPHEPRETERLHRKSAVRDVHEAQQRESPVTPAWTPWIVPWGVPRS